MQSKFGQAKNKTKFKKNNKTPKEIDIIRETMETTENRAIRLELLEKNVK